jgi:hypothetical protein
MISFLYTVPMLTSVVRPLYIYVWLRLQWRSSSYKKNNIFGHLVVLRQVMTFKKTVWCNPQPFSDPSLQQRQYVVYALRGEHHAPVWLGPLVKAVGPLHLRLSSLLS